MNRFMTIGAIGGTGRVKDRFGTEIAQQSSRLTGVNRRLLRGYQESPARFLPKSKSLSLKKLMGGKKK